MEEEKENYLILELAERRADGKICPQQLTLTVKVKTANLYSALYSVSKKNVPDIFSRNSRKHCQIFIIL